MIVLQTSWQMEEGMFGYREMNSEYEVEIGIEEMGKGREEEGKRRAQRSREKTRGLLWR